MLHGSPRFRFHRAGLDVSTGLLEFLSRVLWGSVFRDRCASSPKRLWLNPMHRLIEPVDRARAEALRPD